MVSIKKLLEKMTTQMKTVTDTANNASTKVSRIIPSTSTFVEQKELIGSNPSPSSSFAAQTLTSSSSGGVSGKVLSNYNEIEIYFSDNIRGKQEINSQGGVVSYTTQQYSNDNMVERFRQVIPYSSSIYFNECQYKGFGTGGRTQDNASLRPLTIYGIKRIYGN